MKKETLNNESSWKQKAILRQRQNKDLRKRLKETRLSRNGWKLKASQHKEIIKNLESELSIIKKNLLKILEKI